MKVFWSFMFVAICCFITACSASNSEKNEQPLDFLEVDVSILPSNAEVEDMILFEAIVTYGKKPVVDADKVIFEIWHSNAKETEKINVEHAQDGIYKLEKSFSEEGTYYIYAHVTAEGLHAMPKKTFVIGEPSEKEISE